MNTRKVLCFLLAAVLLTFASCGKVNDVPAETTQPVEKELQYHCPWEYDVCARAVENGTMDYYFMTNEGVVTTDDDTKPWKWGDCCLIVFPDGQTMLIDSGIAAYGPVLAENLNRMGVKRLDYIVISHHHSDHQNGVFHPDNLTGSGVLDQFDVGQVYHRGGRVADRSNADYIDLACTERNIPAEILEMGDTLQIGEVSVQVLWPKQGTSETELPEEGSTAAMNNSSIVLRFDYREHSSLFTGDLYDDGEIMLMSANDISLLDVDLLKAPHHGDDTSSSDLFLMAVSADVAVATGFEYMAEKIRNAYIQNSTTLLDDRTYGYVHISTDGKEMIWESSRQEPLPIAPVFSDS